MSTAETTLRTILTGHDESASKAIKGAAGEAQSAQKHFAGLGKIAAGVFGGNALTEGGRKAIEFLKGSVEAAVDDEASQRKLAIALKNTTGANKEQTDAVGEWLTKQSEAYGVSKDDLMPAFQRLAESTGSITKAQKEMTLAQNISAGTGKNLATVSSALMKANNGTVSSLARLGLKTKDAQGNTLSLKAAMKGMADTFHGQAEARANSLQGQMDRLHSEFHETEVEVGDKLIPTLTALGSWFFQKGLPAAKEMASSLSTELRPAVEDVKGGIEALEPILHTVGDFLEKNPKTVKTFGVALGIIAVALAVVTAATWAWDAALEANPLGLVVIGLAALAAGFQYAYTHSEKFRSIVQKTMADVRATISGFVSFFEAAWHHFGGDITGIAKAYFGILIGVIKGDLQVVRGVIKVVTSLIHGDWAGVWQGLKMIAGGVLTSIVALVKNVPHLLGGFAGLFLNAGKMLIHALFMGFVAEARAGVGFVSDLVGAIKNAVNSALHLPLSVNFDKGPLHIHATVIPALAKGGIVNRPTMALIGEAGPEAVVPLSGRNAGALGGGDVYVTVQTLDLRNKDQLVRDLGSAFRQAGVLRGGRDLTVRT